MAKSYIQIADLIAERIAAGELAVGAQLPPQRGFAHDFGIAASTASRVYEELRRRGLVTGEVGRGTFVANRFRPLDPPMQEPAGSGLDLEIVFRVPEKARDRIAKSTAGFFRSGLSKDAMTPATAKGHPSARDAVAQLISSKSHRVSPDTILLAGNGKQAIAACFSALAPRGGRIAVEALTYPFAISAARMLGITLVPLPLDHEGITPDALARAATEGLHGVYLQPTLHSPLVLTMSDQRRAQISEILRKHNLTAIEDRVYGFMKPTLPLAALAPDHVIQIDSLSKRLMPGASVGIINAPVAWQDTMARALRSGGWMAPAMSVALAEHWINDGTVAFVQEAKRTEARDMFACANAAFAGLSFNGAPDALHGWLELPGHWRAEPFTAACADVGIAVAPGRAFTVGQGVAPAAVRIAFSAPDLTIWRSALDVVAALARRGPG